MPTPIWKEKDALTEDAKAEAEKLKQWVLTGRDEVKTEVKSHTALIVGLCSAAFLVGCLFVWVF